MSLRFCLDRLEEILRRTLDPSEIPGPLHEPASRSEVEDIIHLATLGLALLEEEVARAEEEQERQLDEFEERLKCKDLVIADLSNDVRILKERIDKSALEPGDGTSALTAGL